MPAFRTAALAAALGLVWTAHADAASLRVTITNVAPSGGLSLTPLFGAFHDGTVDFFDAEDSASPGVEEIAETGSPAGVTAEAGPGADTVFIASPSGPPPIEPGESDSVIVDVDAANRFFSFLSMVLPSNDTFIGNDDPTAYAVLSDDGSFLGPITIAVTGQTIYDAGTEANDFALGPAFVQGQDIALGGPGEGTIQQGLGLGAIPAGLLLATGGTLDPDLADFVSDPAAFQLATIQITAVPVPLSGVLLLTGLAGLGLAGQRRKA